MSFDIIIPARYGASRLPGKPLLKIHNKPLIQWVYECAQNSEAKRTIVATDDERIFEVVRGFGGEVCMTRSEHPSGTDRIHEVVAQFAIPDDQIVVNLQGDEPQIPSEILNQLGQGLQNLPAVDMATVAHPVDNPEDLDDPNVVKVVCNEAGMALYFSRSRIPYPRSDVTMPTYRHLGVYAYRAGFLKRFTQKAPTPLERSESLEQLRALEMGDPIRVFITDHQPPGGIDTQADLEQFRREMHD